MIGIFGIVLAVVAMTASAETTECQGKALPCLTDFTSSQSQLMKFEACNNLVNCVKNKCNIVDISQNDFQNYINMAKNMGVDCKKNVPLFHFKLQLLLPDYIGVLLQSTTSGTTTSPSSSSFTSRHGDTQRVISSTDGSLMNGGGNSLSTLNLKTLLIVICVFVLNM